jgi:hypothetical protein
MHKLRYTRVYADTQGESHIEGGEIELAVAGFAPPAPPLHVSKFVPAASVGFLRANPGWFGDWHPAPRRQWMVVLSGEEEIRTSDGAVRRFHAGDIVLAEDTTGKGHQSRVIGTEECVDFCVQLPD